MRTMIVTASGLTRSYGEGEATVHALSGVDVAFPQGRFTAIMGPSGSGKSTLMHLLAGLDRPTSGSVVLAGTELAGLGDKELTALRRDKVGFIFQSFNLLPVLSAEENILLPLSIAGRKPDQEWVDRLIDTVGLRGRLGTGPQSSPAASSSASRSPGRSPPGPRSSSPTSRRATWTPRPPPRSWSSCSARSPSSVRRS
jgi:putative ABC transport system ATP-binding protein